METKSKTEVITTPYDLQDFLENRSTWKYAKTMPKWPHFYALKKQYANYEEFFSAVRFIRRFGYQEYFYDRVMTRFNVNGWKYWSMGQPVHRTILINKARIDEIKSDYDKIAGSYDAMFDGDQFKQEERELFGIMGDLEGSVLDIGCGTGLLLDYYAIDPEDYMGIDPSSEMLKRFVGKYPDYGPRLRKVSAEAFIHTGTFDNVVAIFCASYVSVFESFLKYWNGRGKLFLVFFNEEYKPAAHNGQKRPPQFARFTKEELVQHLGGEVIEYGNYFILKR